VTAVPFQSRNTWLPFVKALLVLAGVLLLYRPAWHGDFLWDDNVLLTENSFVHAPDGLFKIWLSTEQPDYIPLTTTSFWIEWRLWGLHSTGYHVTNILLHALAAFLFWRTLLLLKTRGAGFAAILFAVHPVCTTTVAWIAERKNTLSLVFLLLAVLNYLKATVNPGESKPRQRAWLGVSFACFLCALLSKASAVPLPAVLVLIEWWRCGNLDRRAILRTLPFFALTLVFSAVTIWFQSGRHEPTEMIPDLSLGAKASDALQAIWFYAFEIFWPANLCMVHAWKPATFITAGLSLAALSVLALLFWKYRRSWGRHGFLAVGSFIILLSPVLGFIAMSFHMHSRVADHWNYLPMLPIIAAIGALGGQVSTTWRLTGLKAALLGAGAVIPLAALTWKESHMYVGRETLWRTTLLRNPASWAAHSNLGETLMDSGQVDEAIRHYEAAVQLQPAASDSQYNLANALCAKREYPAAVERYQEAIRHRPRYAAAFYNLGLAYEAQNKLPEAMDAYRNAIAAKATHANAHNNLGTLLARTGSAEDAEKQYLKALALNPNLPDAHNNLANLLFQRGDVPAALQHYGEAVRLKPDYVEAHSNMATVLSNTDRDQEARAHWMEALKFRPTYIDARINFANYLLARKDYAAAAEHFTNALQQTPALPQAHYQLAVIKVALQDTQSARKHLDAALALSPDFAEARRLLEDLNAGISEGRTRNASP
jgi:protein O-mannosyl-transferase